MRMKGDGDIVQQIGEVGRYYQGHTMLFASCDVLMQAHVRSLHWAGGQQQGVEVICMESGDESGDPTSVAQAVEKTLSALHMQ